MSFARIVRVAGASRAPLTLVFLRSTRPSVQNVSISTFLEASLPRQSFARQFATESEQKATAEAASTEDGAAADPRDAEVAALKKKLSETDAALKELKRTYLTTLADMENVRRIAKNDVTAAKEYALTPFAKALLLAVDTIAQAVASVDPAKIDKMDADTLKKSLTSLHEGVAATQKVFTKVLGEHKIVPVGVEGEKFDYDKHEALVKVPVQEQEKHNTVQSVFQQGWILKDRVLRPAKVVVNHFEAKKPQ